VVGGKLEAATARQTLTLLWLRTPLFFLMLGVEVALLTIDHSPLIIGCAALGTVGFAVVLVTNWRSYFIQRRNERHDQP